MQILGKSSKVLLIVVAIIMLVAVGVSFAMWDTMSIVKAGTGNLSTYANAKVGDVIIFGKYYQTGIKDETTGEYEKTPIEWLVVDKDERMGQLTLMSKYILACGSYFGNWYDDGSGNGWNYSGGTLEVGNVPYNQAYVDSTVRAYLNNLERLDMGGDGFTSGKGYVPSKLNSTGEKGLLTSVGFSNQKYWTGLNYATDADKKLVDSGNKGLIKRNDASSNEIYYQRPISNAEFMNRPATKGFLEEAFTDAEKLMLIPKVIAGCTGYRWPDDSHDISIMSYVEGSVDKVWIPSATELNIMNGVDWNDQSDDLWTNPSDESSTNVFQYFKNLQGDNLINALKTTRTMLAKDGKAGNYSIPVYDKGTSNVKTAINTNANSADQYWTRSQSSPWFNRVRIVLNNGKFYYGATRNSDVGVRPCVILKY